MIKKLVMMGFGIILIGLFIFSHATPERTIRTGLFFKGHFTDAFKTTVFLSRNDAQYGEQYSCKNPGIGPDFISVEKGTFGLWYVNWKNSGGG